MDAGNFLGNARRMGANGLLPGEPRNYQTDVLIYQGDATATGDAESFAEIAGSHGLKYDTVSSNELDSMSLDQLASYGVIVWPGGYAGQMSNSLRAETREKIRKAVVERGVGFNGTCAGAFIAVSPDTSWGFSIIPANTLDYFRLENQGVEISMADVKFADGKTRNMVWYGGPQMPEWPGGTIARYDDGNPALAQTWAGEGFVTLSGPHPEAPQSWYDKNGLSDADGRDVDVAWQMMEAALKRKPLPAFM